MSKRHLFLSGGVGSLVVLLAVLAIRAQDPSKPAPAPIGKPIKIAVADIDDLYRQNEDLKQKLENLKKDAEELGKGVVQGQGVLWMAENQFKAMTPGTPEYAEMEEKITRLKTENALQTQSYQREMRGRQAKIYLESSRVIIGEITKCCEENEIGLAIRFSGDPVDSNNPNSILANINKPVVYYDKKLDITPDVLKRIRKKENQEK